MPEGQKDILYIANDNFGAAMASPHIQYYKKKGWEVLVAGEPLDEPCMIKMITYESKPIMSVEKTQSKICKLCDVYCSLLGLCVYRVLVVISA